MSRSENITEVSFRIYPIFPLILSFRIYIPLPMFFSVFPAKIVMLLFY